MEQDMFGTVALPFYAVVDSNGKTISSFPGLTRNVPEFVDFLKKAQNSHRGHRVIHRYLLLWVLRGQARLPDCKWFNSISCS